MPVTENNKSMNKEHNTNIQIFFKQRKSNYDQEHYVKQKKPWHMIYSEKHSFILDRISTNTWLPGQLEAPQMLN